jgi:hypothetical protein
MNRESFVCYPSFLDAIKKMPEQLQGKAALSVLELGIDGEWNDSDPYIDMMLTLIAPNILAAKDRYAASKENGKKGGRPPKVNIEKIKEMAKAGKTNLEIAKEFNCNDDYIRQLLKQENQENPNYLGYSDDEKQDNQDNLNIDIDKDIDINNNNDIDTNNNTDINNNKENNNNISFTAPQEQEKEEDNDFPFTVEDELSDQEEEIKPLTPEMAEATKNILLEQKNDNETPFMDVSDYEDYGDMMQEQMLEELESKITLKVLGFEDGGKRVVFTPLSENQHLVYEVSREVAEKYGTLKKDDLVKVSNGFLKNASNFDSIYKYEII